MGSDSGDAAGLTTSESARLHCTRTRVTNRFLLLAAGCAVVVGVAAGAPEQASATHVSCGDTISQNVKLDSDLVNCPGDGVSIGADNITLDLAGHTIGGDGARDFCDAGVANGEDLDSCLQSGRSGYAGVTIKNGAVTGFGSGVELRGAVGNVVRDLSASGNRTGINLIDAVESRVRKNTLSGNGLGMFVSNEGTPDRNGSNRLTRNLVLRNGSGVVVEGSDGNRISDNSAIDNLDEGIGLDGSRGNRIDSNAISGSCNAIMLHHASENRVARNLLTGNRCAGIEATDGDHDNRFEQNVISRNGGDGIVAEGSQRIVGNTTFENGASGITVACEPEECLVRRNVSYGNVEGIVVRGFGNTLVERNFAIDNARDGIRLSEYGAGAKVLRNTARQNGDDGIDVDDPATTLTRNTATKNLDFGIDAVPGVIDGGGNRARGNGNPAQCANVGCG